MSFPWNPPFIDFAARKVCDFRRVYHGTLQNPERNDDAHPPWYWNTAWYDPPQWIDPVPQGSVILETGINQANLIYDKLWKIMKESLFFSIQIRIAMILKPQIRHFWGNSTRIAHVCCEVSPIYWDEWKKVQPYVKNTEHGWYQRPCTCVATRKRIDMWCATVLVWFYFSIFFGVPPYLID